MSYTNQGIQEKALKAMIDRLLEDIESDKLDEIDRKNQYKKGNEAKIRGGLTTYLYNLARNAYFVFRHPRRAYFWIRILF